ncbi:MAG: PAS domain S-box protein, partial [Dehalococcoidia bacterium]
MMNKEDLIYHKPVERLAESGVFIGALGSQQAGAILGEQSALLLTLQKEVEALRESEGFYRDLFEGSPAGYLAVSSDGFIQRINRTAAQILGYSVDELIGRSILEIHPDCLKTKAKVQEVAAVLQNGKKVFEEETEMQCKDGTKIWVNLSLHPMRDAAGHIQRIHAILSDVTERKRAEAALKKNEAFLAEAQQMAHLGNWEWNHSNNEVICSEEVYRIFGLQPGGSSLPPSSFLESIYPDDLEYVKNSFNEALHEGKPYNTDYCIVLPGGEVRIVHSQGKASSDESGHPIRASGTVQDITDRKTAEEKLAESERLYSTMSNSSPIGVYIVQDGKFVFVNQQFCKMTGFDEDKLIGLESLSLVHPEDRAIVKGNAIRMLKGQVNSGYEFRAITKNGETRAILETVASIQYRGKRASLGNYMDITERKQAEEQIIRRNRDL